MHQAAILGEVYCVKARHICLMPVDYWTQSLKAPPALWVPRFSFQVTVLRMLANLAGRSTNKVLRFIVKIEHVLPVTFSVDWTCFRLATSGQYIQSSTGGNNNNNNQSACVLWLVVASSRSQLGHTARWHPGPHWFAELELQSAAPQQECGVPQRIWRICGATQAEGAFISRS